MNLSCELAALGDHEEKGVARISLWQSSRWDKSPATSSYFPGLGPRRKWENFHELCILISTKMCAHCWATYVLGKLQYHGQSKARCASLDERMQPKLRDRQTQRLALNQVFSLPPRADQVKQRVGLQKASPIPPQPPNGIRHEATLPDVVQHRVPNEKWPGY